jgi:hypothetical protein
MTALEKLKPATHAQIAALEFGLARPFRKMSQKQRIRKAHDLVNRLRPWAVIALETVAFDKQELIDRVAEGYDDLGPMLMHLARAGEDARALLDLIRSAEVKLAVALANVEPDEDEPPAA